MQAFAPIGGNLYVTYLENAVLRVKKVFPTRNPSGAITSSPGLGQPNVSVSVSGRWDSQGFSSVHQLRPSRRPSRTAATTSRQNTIGVWWRSNVPLDSDAFEVEQVWYPSKDGTEIPMFLVHKKGLKRDGNNPTLLSGYGGFNVSLTPAFAAAVAALARSTAACYAVRQPARRRRVRRGVAPGRHARARSRTSSTTSSPRPSG